MPWIWLLFAGLTEVVWAIGLKKFGLRPSPGGAFTVVTMILSFVLLDRAMRHLPLGTSYVVWTGIGAVGTALIGMIALGEPRDWPRVLCIALIVIGVLGLKFLQPTEIAPSGPAQSASDTITRSDPEAPRRT